MGIIGRIRKYSWVAVLFVGIAILAFILGDLTKNNRQIPDVGKVDGNTMTRMRFDELVEENENNYKMQQQTTQVPSEVMSQIRESVWQNFIDETLLAEQTERMGLRVTPAEVSDMYTGQFIHPYLRRQFTNPETGQYDYASVNSYIERFDQLDTASRMQWVELEKAVKKDRQQQKYAGMIMAGFYMPKAIAEKVASYSKEVSNIRVAMLPYQSVKDEEVTINDADLKAYYEEHKAEFQVNETMRELNFITFPINPSPKDLADIENEVNKTWAEFQQQPDEEIPFFVNTVSHHSYDSAYLKPSAFKAPMDAQIAAAEAGTLIAPVMVGNEWQMAKVMKTAARPDSLRASTIIICNNKAGERITSRSDEQAKQLADSVLALVKGNKMSFEEAVEQFSDDPQKGQNKGDFGWQLDGNYGYLNEDIVKTPVGGCFMVEEARGIGYCIVKVTDKTPATKKYRVALITHDIIPSKATNDAVFSTAHKFAARNRSLAAMEQAAQEENLQMRTARVGVMTENLTGVPNSRDIIRWAYNDDTEVGAVADQVYECEGMFVVAALKDVYEKGIATLKQVTPMIEQSVRIEKKGELLLARAEEAIKAGKDINSIAVKLNVTVDTLDSVAFNDYYVGRYGMEPKVQSVVAVTKSGIAAPVKGANGVYVIQVDGKVAREGVDAAAVKSQFDMGYRNKMRYISQTLRNKADIVDMRHKSF